jgi:hypothetical protein
MAQEEKYLDDIGESPEAEAPAAEAPEIEAEAQEPAPQADTQPDAERSKKPDTRPEGYVTKGERDRLASELQEARQARALSEERFAKIVERFYKDHAPEQTADDPKPDLNQDPMGYIAWKERQDQRAENEKKALDEAEGKRREEERHFTDTLNRATARLQKVVAARPEIGKLYEDVRLAAAKEYSEKGVPDHQLKQWVDNYEASVIKWAREEYIPIEDALEQVAAQFGIKVQPAAQRPTPERDPATGQFLPSEAEKAAKIAQSQERNASLGAAPGAPVKKMSPAELAKLPEEEMWKHFDSLKGQKGSKNFDRDMGFRS